MTIIVRPLTDDGLFGFDQFDQFMLGTKDVAISIKATHFCVKARGVMDSTSYTTTTSLGGVFKTQPDTRAEFLGGLKG